MKIVEELSYYILPLALTVVALVIFLGKRDYFSSFLSGAKNGISSSFSLLPSICALVVGTSMLSESGAIEIISDFLAPVFDFIRIPKELLPLILTRPLSYGASLATFNELIDMYGIDSLCALCASVIMASSDTCFYVISVYLSSNGIKKTRFAIPLCIFVTAFSVVLSCFLAQIFFA